MNKKKFTSQVNKKLKKMNLSSGFEESSKIVDVIIEEMFLTLSEGKTLYFRKFGKFESIFRNFRVPSTGKMVRSIVVNFKASARLKNEIKGNG